MYAESITGTEPYIEHITRLLTAPDVPAPRPEWVTTIKDVGVSAGGEPEIIAAFAETWRLFYTATLLLDHLQDGDVLTPVWFAAEPPAQQYHFVFSAYAIAQHALATLATDLPSERAVQLHSFWNSTVVSIATGQYRDLTQTLDTVLRMGQSPLDVYEAIIAQKTGAVFALAFGGVAMLATDDEAQIAAATDAGTVFGMLLQYSDDLRDDPSQVHQQTLTLQRALITAQTATGAADQLAVTWPVIFSVYTRSLKSVLAPLPAPAGAAIEGIVADAFGSVPAALLQNLETQEFCDDEQ